MRGLQHAGARPAAPPPAAPAPAGASIVKGVGAATGQGCADVVAASAAGAARGRSRAVWTTRPHRSSAAAESSCVLALRGPRHAALAVRITFADAAAVPAALRFEHAPAPAAVFSTLGEVRLHAKSMQQLKHVFRLGAAAGVHRCLRVTATGHIARQHSGMHQVSHLEVTGEQLAPPAAAGAPSLGASVSVAAPANALLETAGSAPAELEVDLSASVMAEVAAVAIENKRKHVKAAPPAPPPLPPALWASPTKHAAPPPPPLPGMARRAAAAAAVAPEAPPIAAAPADVDAGPAPSRPTVKFFWDKLALQGEAVGATVWGQLGGVPGGLDFAELEEEFAAKPPAPKASGSLGWGVALQSVAGGCQTRQHTWRGLGLS
jgi:hypothetical protein